MGVVVVVSVALAAGSSVAKPPRDAPDPERKPPAAAPHGNGSPRASHGELPADVIEETRAAVSD